MSTIIEVEKLKKNFSVLSATRHCISCFRRVHYGFNWH